jgi:hypothetical protein
MDSFLIDCLDEDACYTKLVELLHPDGLACPRCGERHDLDIHRRHREPVVEELLLGVLGTGDQNLVVFATEVGTPGTPSVPWSGRTSHWRTLKGNIPRDFPKSLVGRAEVDRKPGYGSAIPAWAYVIMASIGATGFEPATSRTRIERSLPP